MALQDAVNSVKQSPEYGYSGRIDDILKKEYSHLGGCDYIY